MGGGKPCAYRSQSPFWLIAPPSEVASGAGGVLSHWNRFRPVRQWNLCQNDGPRLHLIGSLNRRVCVCFNRTVCIWDQRHWRISWINRRLPPSATPHTPPPPTPGVIISNASIQLDLKRLITRKLKLTGFEWVEEQVVPKLTKLSARCLDGTIFNCKVDQHISMKLSFIWLHCSTEFKFEIKFDSNFKWIGFNAIKFYFVWWRRGANEAASCSFITAASQRAERRSATRVIRLARYSAPRTPQRNNQLTDKFCQKIGNFWNNFLVIRPIVSGETCSFSSSSFSSETGVAEIEFNWPNLCTDFVISLSVFRARVSFQEDENYL